MRVAVNSNRLSTTGMINASTAIPVTAIRIGHQRPGYRRSTIRQAKNASVGDLPSGDVLIEDGRIAAVAATVDAADAEVVDATGKIVLPGFVDTHRHTWQTAFRGLGADWTFDQYRVAMHGTLRPHYRPEDV